MAGESVQVAGEKDKSCLVGAIDRLGHCASKAWALSDVKFGDLTSSGEAGISLFLYDLARALDDIEKDLCLELKRQQ